MITAKNNNKINRSVIHGTELTTLLIMNAVTLAVSLAYDWNLGNIVVLWWWQSLIIGFYYFLLFKKIPLSYYDDFLKNNPDQIIRSPEKFRNHTAGGYLLIFGLVLFTMWILISAFDMRGDMSLLGLIITLSSFVWGHHKSYKKVEPSEIDANLTEIINTPYKRALPILLSSLLASFLITSGFAIDANIIIVVVFVFIKTLLEIRQRTQAPI